MKISVIKYGEQGILIQWETIIDPNIHDEVIATSKHLLQNYSDVIEEIVPSYQSLLIFVKTKVDIESYRAQWQSLTISKFQQSETRNTWRIPVCYAPAFGLDLETMSGELNLSTEKIIELHSAADYRIYGMGFLPGFLYLGGLTEEIHASRKKLVHPAIPKGSVAIGGSQTGIYPQESPGGWNIIGRTPVLLFDIKKEVPTPFSVGDSIAFYPISELQFQEIEQEVLEGTYQFKKVES